MRLTINPIAVFLYSCSVTILLAGGVLLYLLLQPVDVLKNWQITVAPGAHYPGETITVDSHYTKLKDVTGRAYRYLDCKNQRSTYTRYTISNAPANNQAGVSRSTGIFMTIPSDITVPTTCHVSILVEYKVNPLRTQPEFTQSNEFNLTAKPNPVSGDSTSSSVNNSNGTTTTTTNNTATSTPAQSAAQRKASPQPSTTNTANNNAPVGTPATTPPSCAVSLLGLNLLCN